nr:T7SS effector LXG polymorphic toxin [Staphylococcus caledonicus]
MYVGRSKKQASDVGESVKSLTSSYEDLQKGIMQFIGEGELQGQTYDSGKQFFSTVILPLTESIKILDELTEQACREFVEKYQADVDTQSLKESELEEDIHELEHQISQLEAMNASLSLKPSQNSALLSSNQQMMESLQNQKNELEDKLRKLRQFDAESSHIFKEVESFQNTVQQGINQAKTSWNPGKQVFHIPFGKEMEWAQVSQQKALDIRMKKINPKVEDGKKLNKDDLQVVRRYTKKHPKEDVPKNLKEYIIQNKESITRDLGFDITSNGIEQVGFNIQKFAGVLNTYGGFQGPNSKNSFIQVTNQSGNQMIKHGRIVSKIGKVGGYSTMGIGFSLGMYDDLTNNNKTIGEAVAHNGLTTGVGVGATIVATVALSSTPVGWAILDGMATSTTLVALVDLAYQNNWQGVKDGVDWTGHQIDKGIAKYLGFKINQHALEVRGANFVKHKLQDSSKDISKRVKTGTKFISNESKKIRNNIGEAIKDVKKVTNPMNRSY